jgi:hypothetical protein
VYYHLISSHEFRFFRGERLRYLSKFDEDHRALSRRYIFLLAISERIFVFRPARHHGGFDEEGEERNQKLRIPIGLRLGSGGNKGASYDNRNTWLVNSERARQLRREFVQEGFRRLYRSADLHQREKDDDCNVTLLTRANGTMGSIIGTLIGAIRTTIGAIGSLGNSFVTLNEALATEFGQANVSEVNHVTSGDTRPQGDWMYYAQ